MAPRNFVKYDGKWYSAQSVRARQATTVPQDYYIDNSPSLVEIDNTRHEAFIKGQWGHLRQIAGWHRTKETLKRTRRRQDAAAARERVA
jgi:hypothetical protein